MTAPTSSLSRSVPDHRSTTPTPQKNQSATFEDLANDELPSIRKIELVASDITDDDFLFQIRSAARLTFLRLENCPKLNTIAFKQASYPASLKEVSIHHCAIDKEGIRKILTSCTDLKRLVCSKNTLTSTKELSTLRNEFKNVTIIYE